MLPGRPEAESIAGEHAPPQSGPHQELDLGGRKLRAVPGRLCQEREALPGHLRRLLANRSTHSRRPAIPGCGSVLLELSTTQVQQLHNPAIL